MNSISFRNHFVIYDFHKNVCDCPIQFVRLTESHADGQGCLRIEIDHKNFLPCLGKTGAKVYADAAFLICNGHNLTHTASSFLP